MKKRRKGRITEILNPLEKTHTQYGFITNEEWTRREAVRINRAGKDIALAVLNKNGTVHLEIA